VGVTLGCAALYSLSQRNRRIATAHESIVAAQEVSPAAPPTAVQPVAQEAVPPVETPALDQPADQPEVTTPAPADTVTPAGAVPIPEPAAERPAEKLVEKPMEKLVEKPAEKPVERPAEKAAGKPAEKTAGKPVEKAAGKPTEKVVGKPVEKPSGKPTPRPVEQAYTAAPDGSIETPNQVPVSETTVHVELLPSEPVWVEARTDGRLLFSDTLEANKTRLVEANTTVLLRIGNAGGVSIRLNGKLIGVVGPKGQVKTVQLTSGGFEIVAAPKGPSAPLNPAR